jgi:peptidoglycan hydrolase-like protein with peptidoglycan-binding domain
LLLIIAVLAGFGLLRSLNGGMASQATQTAPADASQPATDPSPNPAADGIPTAPEQIQSSADINLSPIDQAQVVRDLEQGLRQGSQGQAVEMVQRQLQRLNLLETAPNGTFGPQTAEAVRRFQTQAKVTGDRAGTVRRATGIALIAAGSRPRLEMGANNADVRRLQLALALALRRRLDANGNFEPATLQAVKDYQRTRGLPVTGIVADKTWLALQQGR